MDSKQFKKYREDLGLTQKQLAEKLCVSYWTVVKWENGSDIPLCCQKLFSIMYSIPFEAPREKSDAWRKTPDLPFE